MKTYKSPTRSKAATSQGSSPKPVASPTVKGSGPIVFRSATVRDLAAILEVNSAVQSWCFCREALGPASSRHVPDIRMVDSEGQTWLLDAPDRPVVDRNDFEAAARDIGARYRFVPREEIYSGFTLRNARDLLRYATYTVSLADRIRLLATLDEQGSLPMSDCLSVVRAGEPVAAVAALMLHGFLEADLDEALLGPETMVRRIRV